MLLKVFCYKPSLEFGRLTIRPSHDFVNPFAMNELFTYGQVYQRASLVLINGNHLLFHGTYPSNISNHIKENGWFFNEIISKFISLRWSLNLVEGVHISGMPCWIDEMDSPSSNKGTHGSRPKFGGGPDVKYWNNWWWKRNNFKTITLWTIIC